MQLTVIIISVYCHSCLNMFKLAELQSDSWEIRRRGRQIGFAGVIGRWQRWRSEPLAPLKKAYKRPCHWKRIHCFLLHLHHHNRSRNQRPEYDFGAQGKNPNLEEYLIQYLEQCSAQTEVTAKLQAYIIFLMTVGEFSLPVFLPLKFAPWSLIYSDPKALGQVYMERHLIL